MTRRVLYVLGVVSASVALHAHTVASLGLRSPADVLKCALAQNIIPGAAPVFDAQLLLSVTYASGSANFTSPCPNGTHAAHSFPGLTLDVDPCDSTPHGTASTRNMPIVTWDARPGMYYTLAKWDFTNNFLHYLSTNLLGNTVSTVGRVAFPYQSPLNPTPKPNPYVWLLFEHSFWVQPDTIDEALWSSPDPLGPRVGYNITAFAAKYKLGAPVALSWVHVPGDAWCSYAWSQVVTAPWIPETTRSMVNTYYGYACRFLG